MKEGQYNLLYFSFERDLKISMSEMKDKEKEGALIVSMISVLNNAKSKEIPIERKNQSISNGLEELYKNLNELDEIISESFGKGANKI